MESTSTTLHRAMEQANRLRRAAGGVSVAELLLTTAQSLTDAGEPTFYAAVRAGSVTMHVVAEPATLDEIALALLDRFTWETDRMIRELGRTP